MRAGVLLSIIAGVGCRRAAWLLNVLFHVEVSKSSLFRWIDDVADRLPTAEEIIRQMDKTQPITEGHLDELFRVCPRYATKEVTQIYNGDL